MRSLTVAIWLCIGVATASQATATPCATATCGLKGAPAPEIGTGIPVVLVVGAVLLGATLMKRWGPSA